jgi:hypothetical protein
MCLTANNIGVVGKRIVIRIENTLPTQSIGVKYSPRKLMGILN